MYKSTHTTSMVKVAYTCLKMTNKLIANLSDEKGSQPKHKVFRNEFTGLEKKNQNPPLRFVILYIE